MQAVLASCFGGKTMSHLWVMTAITLVNDADVLITSHDVIAHMYMYADYRIYIYQRVSYNQ